MAFKPSPLQQKIYDFVNTGEGSAIIAAVAGSGKTTTIVNALQFISPTKKVIFLAFNKAIATELATKVPDFVSCKTLNAAGMGAFRNMVSSGGRAFFKVDGNKTKNIVAFMGLQYDVPETMKLVALGKSYGVAPRNMQGVTGITKDTDQFWLDLMDHYDMDIPAYRKAAIIENVLDVLRAGLQDVKVIDFDDMMYMPVVMGAKFDKYDWVFVDEAQDVSPIQRAMLGRMLADNGRLVAVGDKAQCHPPHTRIHLTGGTSIPISEVKVGMKVVSYHDVFRGIVSQGRKVLEVGVRPYAGKLIRIIAGNEQVEVTPNHRIPTRLSKNASGYAVYLMETAETSRLGMCQLVYAQGFGPSMRRRHERADRVWVLAVFKDRDDAMEYETLTALKYNLPENIFFEKGRLKERLFRKIGSNREKAKACLTDHGKDHDYPICKKGDKKHVGKYIYITEACNLIEGANDVRTFDGTRDGGEWITVMLDKKYVKTDVYSLSVEPTEGGHRLYVAENILVHNSIYGFRGSDSASLGNIAKEFSAITLPLSISYRCPQAVVRHAQQVVSHIEASPTAIEGIVQTWGEYTGEEFRYGAGIESDMIICRNTAPLIKVAYGLIGRQIPAKVLGRDIGTNLIKLIDKLKPKGVDGENGLISKLEEWREKETAKLMKADKEDMVQSVEDKYETLMAFISGTKADTVPKIKQAIEELFGSDQKQAVTLCTIHKSKGLEAKRVFVLDDHLMPSKYARKEWQIEQEQNLRYVAYTRAQEALIFIDSKQLVDKKKADINAMPELELESRLITHEYCYCCG